MAGVHIFPTSTPPTLDEDASSEERVEAMVDWFLSNFEDPANSLPYESREGGYQWIWGGPFDAEEEIIDAFEEAVESEILEAVQRVERSGIVEWTPAGHRLGSLEGADDDDEPYFDPDHDPNGTRRLPPENNRRAYQTVETILFPQRNYRWSMHATFIPGNTNSELGKEFDELDDSYNENPPFENYGDDIIKLPSLKEAVSILIYSQIEINQSRRKDDLYSSIEWLESIIFDREIFVDDSIIVHNSPATWLPLSKMFSKGMDATSISAILITSTSIGNGAGLLLAYGGARIFLRLVHNVNYLQDAFVERLGNRIRRGDFDKGKKDKS